VKKFIFLLSLSLLFVLGGCHPNMLKKPQAGDPNIRVLITEISQPKTLIFDGTYILTSEEARYEFGKNNSSLTIESLPDGFKLFNGNRYFMLRNRDRVIFRPKDGKSSFRLDGNTFRGSLHLLKNGSKTLLAINHIGLESYLKAVVPSEMPSAKKEYLEALKAQAICARTYALKKMLERKNEPFDVFADTRDQAYNGLAAETDLADLATGQTRGDVLMYHDTLATIYYSSTCGGLTEAVQNVWPDKSFPYLQSQQDVLGDSFACSVSPRFRWKRSFSFKDLDSAFSNTFQQSYLKKNVKDSTQLHFIARVQQRSSTGRVQSLKISYGDTTVVLDGYDIRRFFTKKEYGPLPANLFYLQNSDSLLIIRGGGYGHGVGMCQWGALHMSELGFKYYDILVNKYFKGTYLKKVY